MPWLAYLAVAGISAFVGSQIDDAIDTPPADTHAQLPSIPKMMMYGAGGLGLFILARRAKLVK